MKKMTKFQFRMEAGKARINPNLYGLVIDATLPTRDKSQVSGGKVVGIVWFDEWRTEKEFWPGLGEWESPSLPKVPYVVLEKDKETYHVNTFHIGQYLQKILNMQLISMAKAQKKKAD